MFTLLRLIFLPAKVGVGTTKLGVRAGYRTGRMLGYRRMFVFAAGIGVGLLVAPMTGQQARDKLRKLVEERLSGGSTDVAEKIRYELSHSPRTWHLPQPTVDFVNGTAILRGAVRSEEHTSELQSLMRISYAVIYLKKKK